MKILDCFRELTKSKKSFSDRASARMIRRTVLDGMTCIGLFFLTIFPSRTHVSHKTTTKLYYESMSSVLTITVCSNGPNGDSYRAGIAQGNEPFSNMDVSLGTFIKDKLEEKIIPKYLGNFQYSEEELRQIIRRSVDEAWVDYSESHARTPAGQSPDGNNITSIHANTAAEVGNSTHGRNPSITSFATSSTELVALSPEQLNPHFSSEESRLYEPPRYDIQHSNFFENQQMLQPPNMQQFPQQSLGKGDQNGLEMLNQFEASQLEYPAENFLPQGQPLMYNVSSLAETQPPFPAGVPAYNALQSPPILRATDQSSHTYQYGEVTIQTPIALRQNSIQNNFVQRINAATTIPESIPSAMVYQNPVVSTEDDEELKKSPLYPYSSFYN
jgi:hypothetical protein